jgi:hypothetical protein
VLHDLASSSLTGPTSYSTPSLSDGDRYILERAALILNAPLSALLELGQQHNPRFNLDTSLNDVPLPHLLTQGPSLPPQLQPHHHQQQQQQQHLQQQQYPRPKRPRLDSNLPMSSAFTASPGLQDVDEKLPIRSMTQVGNDGRGSYAGFTSEVATSGWNHSGLAACFSSIAMCPPFSPYDSQPGMWITRHCTPTTLAD